MFAKEITDTVLTNDIANNLFGNISAHSYGRDDTFTATLRAMLHKRLPAGETVRLALVPLGNAIFGPGAVADCILQNDSGHTYTIFIAYPQDRELRDRLFDAVREHFGEGKRYFDTYAMREDLRLFYIKKLDGLFYTNGNTMLIFLDYLDFRRFHALQMMIPKYLPGLFADNPLSDDETALLKSLGSRLPDEYERLIGQFARNYDMRDELIRTRLRGFENGFERKRAQEAEQLINTYQSDYQVYLNRLRSTSQALQEQKIILAGLRCRINESSGDSELMEYFLCNKNLSIIRTQDMELEFVVHGYADVFDEDAFDTYAKNHGSALYEALVGGVTKEGMERLYRAIFESGAYRLRVCAAYIADMRNGLTPVMDYVFPPESRDYFPNPHIQQYGCVGSYAGRFAEYMHRNDYVGAIDQAAVSARNLNFHDSSVMRTFANELSRTVIRCVEDADGNLITPREAIKRLEEEAACQSQSS